MSVSRVSEAIGHHIPEQVVDASAAVRDQAERDVRDVRDVRDGADRLAGALRRATQHLLSLQDSTGWWKFDLESNTTMDAEDLLLREFLGIRTESLTAASAKFIRSRQLADGSWPQYFGGPGELSITVESYIALRLAGDEPSAPHMERAASWIRENGGVPATRVFTRIWMALFGWWRWEDLPVLPPEIMLLPHQAPLSIYSFGSWARQTIVPLTIVFALRPVRPAPFGLEELSVDDPDGSGSTTSVAAGTGAGAGAGAGSGVGAGGGSGGAGHGVSAGVGSALRGILGLRGMVPLGWKPFFRWVDAGLHRYHHHPIGPLRRHAMRTAERWIIARQEADGCFGGIQPPAVYSIIALRLLGYDLAHPVLKAALEALDDYSVTLPDGARMIEASQSPVWDTALAVNAIVEAGDVIGIEPDDPALLRAADWLLGQEIRDRSGDWQVNHPDLPGGGWAFEFENDTYPDTDDTAEVLLALRHVRHPAPEKIESATDRTVTWLLGLQSSDGGWGAYDSDNTSTLVYKIPFGDFGALTDPPSADVTAHVVEALVDAGLTEDPRTRRGVSWLLDHQESDGSWFGRWGVNHVYGTGSVLPALAAAGLAPTHPAIGDGVAWLLSRQNSDGGWGEDLRSYSDPRWNGRGVSTASQTAWGMLGLLAGEQGPDVAVALARAADWLAEQQRPDGTWDEDQFTGTGFPGEFYLNYNGYRLIWPVLALGRYGHSLRTSPPPTVVDPKSRPGH